MGAIGKKTAECLRALNKSPDDHEGCLTILNYHCPVHRETRELLVGDDDSSHLTFMTACKGYYRPIQMTTEMFWQMLRRNDGLSFGRWGLTERDDTNTYFLRQMYRALADGLTPEIFSRICHDMVRETNDLEEWLAEQGIK